MVGDTSFNKLNVIKIVINATLLNELWLRRYHRQPYLSKRPLTRLHFSKKNN